MSKLRFLIIFIYISLSVRFVEGSDFLNYQWISLNIGRTNGVFKRNSGNENGIGLIYRVSFSSAIYRNIFVSYQKSKLSEFQAPMYDVYIPIEHFTQRAVYVGYSFTFRDFCFLPAIGYCWMEGTNRGKWLGEIGVESYECESLPYKSNGIPWYFQINTNSNGWFGIGIELSGTLNSKKDYWGVSLLLKIGKQANK